MINIHTPTAGVILCAFCGKEVCPSVEKAEETDWIFYSTRDVCEHTLFVATDEGFEYRSSRFNQHMGLPDDQEPMPDLPPSHEDPDDSMTFDEFTSSVTIPSSVKFTSNDCHIDLYVGFAP